MTTLTITLPISIVVEGQTKPPGTPVTLEAREAANLVARFKGKVVPTGGERVVVPVADGSPPRLGDSIEAEVPESLEAEVPRAPARGRPRR